MHEPAPSSSLPPPSEGSAGLPVAGGDAAETPSVLPVPMEPVQRSERIEVIDILRGFALFGILCVNMQFYTTPILA